ncbi:MAG: hypothetical protein WCD40_08315, partial [Candidatus Acidiferrales bacterium]
DGKSSADSIERLVKSAGHEDLPVAVSDALEFLPLAHYAEPYWQGRFVFLVDPERSLEFIGTDNLDKQVAVLRAFAPIHVYDFLDFADKYPTYLLYSDDGREAFGNVEGPDWWPVRLARDGYSLDLVAAQGTRKIYLVSAGADQRK